MKNKLWFFLLTLTAISCAAEKDVYRITGIWSTAQDGEVVYLQSYDSQTKTATRIDSTTVMKGEFAMSSEMPIIGEYEIATVHGKKAFLLTEEPISIEISINETVTRKGDTIRMANYKFSNSMEQELYEEYQKAKNIGMIGVMGAAFGIPQAQKEGNKEKEDSLVSLYVMALEAEKHAIDSLIDNNRDSYASALLLNKESSKSDTYRQLLDKYDLLSTRVKQSSIGLQLKTTIDRVGMTAIGEPAPLFSGVTPTGDTLSLESLKGKVVLIDFWASWCGPCIKELPNVKAVYEEYKDRGFEVISISLDNKKDAWVNAIETHQIKWLNISTLKGWKCEIAQQYSITGVPTMFLLNEEGIIVATNLHQEKLREEVSKLIN